MHTSNFIVSNDPLAKRIEASKKLLERLRNLKPTPAYAHSILESATHNKLRVLEAHLSTLPDDRRKVMVNELDRGIDGTE
jgi:hypothetical protein